MDTLERDFPVGRDVRGAVARRAPFGVFVDLDGGALGLIRITDLVDASGPEVRARVIGHAPHTRQVLLTQLGLDAP